MKIYKLIIFVVILALAIVADVYYLKFSWFIFTGLFLALLLAYAFLSNFIVKFYRNKKGIPQEKYSYAFPDVMAKTMKKIDMRTQLEGGLLSMFFILIGMALLDIYIIFFMNFDWWFKGLVVFNSICGAAFLLTSMIGQYQSYVTYMQTIDSLNSDEMSSSTLKINTDEMKGGLN